MVKVNIATRKHVINNQYLEVKLSAQLPGRVNPRGPTNRCLCAFGAKATQLLWLTTHHFSRSLYSSWIRCLVRQDLEGSGEARTSSTGMTWKSINIEKIISVSSPQNWQPCLISALRKLLIAVCWLAITRGRLSSTTHRGSSTPHASFSLPFVVESLITQVSGLVWYSRSISVWFGVYQQQVLVFIVSSFCWTDTRSLCTSYMNPHRCQYANMSGANVT